MGWAVEQAGDDAAFALPEGGFAMPLEELFDRAAGRVLDFLIGVDEGKIEASGQAASDGAFAGAHEADKNDGFCHR